MELLFLLGRVLVGVFFIVRGVDHFRNKGAVEGYGRTRGIPSPKFFVPATGIVIILGGLGVLLGVFPRLALLLLILFLVAAAFGVHHFWTLPPGAERMNERIGFEKDLALAGALLMIFYLSSVWPVALM